MQVSRSSASPVPGTPYFAGKAKQLKPTHDCADSRPATNKPSAITHDHCAENLPWIDQVLSQPFFLCSQGGVPFLQNLHKAIIDPEANNNPAAKQTVLNVFNTVLQTKNAKLSGQQSFPLVDDLLHGSNKARQLAEKLGGVFDTYVPNKAQRQSAQAHLDQFAQVLPYQCRGLRRVSDAPPENNLAGTSAKNPPGFDPLSEQEQQALAKLIETTPGLNRNNRFDAVRHLSRTRTQTESGYTPLRVAVENGYLPIVEALLKMPDTDVNAVPEDCDRDSILETAVHARNVKVLAALLAHPETDVTQRSGFFNTNPLESAKGIGDPKIITLLENHIEKRNIKLPPRPQPKTLWEQLCASA